MGYLELSRNDKVEAQEVQPNQQVWFHIERWGGSYLREIVKVDSLGNTTVLTDSVGHRHTVFSSSPVWIREYQEREIENHSER